MAALWPISVILTKVSSLDTLSNDFLFKSLSLLTILYVIPLRLIISFIIAMVSRLSIYVYYMMGWIFVTKVIIGDVICPIISYSFYKFSKFIYHDGVTDNPIRYRISEKDRMRHADGQNETWNIYLNRCVLRCLCNFASEFGWFLRLGNLVLMIMNLKVENLKKRKWKKILNLHFCLYVQCWYWILHAAVKM